MQKQISAESTIYRINIKKKNTMLVCDYIDSQL